MARRAGRSDRFILLSQEVDILLTLFFFFLRDIFVKIGAPFFVNIPSLQENMKVQSWGSWGKQSSS